MSTRDENSHFARKSTSRSAKGRRPTYPLCPVCGVEMSPGFRHGLVDAGSLRGYISCEERRSMNDEQWYYFCKRGKL